MEESRVSPNSGDFCNFRGCCPRFEECNAPLCPLDESLYVGAVWYADEEICGVRDFRNLKFVRIQRKLKRVGRQGYFNLEMLEALGSKPTDGIDPESSRTVEAWVRKRGEGRSVKTVA